MNRSGSSIAFCTNRAAWLPLATSSRIRVRRTLTRAKSGEQRRRLRTPGQPASLSRSLSSVFSMGGGRCGTAGIRPAGRRRPAGSSGRLPPRPRPTTELRSPVASPDVACLDLNGAPRPESCAAHDGRPRPPGREQSRLVHPRQPNTPIKGLDATRRHQWSLAADRVQVEVRKVRAPHQEQAANWPSATVVGPAACRRQELEGACEGTLQERELISSECSWWSLTRASRRPASL